MYFRHHVNNWGWHFRRETCILTWPGEGSNLCERDHCICIEGRNCTWWASCHLPASNPSNHRMKYSGWKSRSFLYWNGKLTPCVGRGFHRLNEWKHFIAFHVNSWDMHYRNVAHKFPTIDSMQKRLLKPNSTFLPPTKRQILWFDLSVCCKCISMQDECIFVLYLLQIFCTAI